MFFKKHPALLSAAAWLLYALILTAALSLGAARITLPDLASILFRGNTGGSAGIIIIKLRLPRIILASLTGASLALGGTVFQAVFRNPMAEPYILGISSGSALGASLVTLLGLQVSLWGISALGLGAFAGAGVSLLILYLFFGRRGSGSRISLLLGGVILSFFLSSLMSLILSMNREMASAILFWSMGSFTTARWEKILFLAPLTLASAVFLFFRKNTLNLLTAGEDAAHTLGLNVQRTSNTLLVTASLLTAATVACSGTIGFIGLLVPHGIRLISGPDHRRLLPLVIPAGAGLTVLADLLARSVHPPMEIPVGVITGLMGAPLFLFLLKKNTDAYIMGDR